MSVRPYRICLVEDDAIMGEALGDRLALEGFECDWHKLGRPALGALARKRYDAVISDIQLPDIDGEALFTEARAGGELPPWIFITAYGAIDSAVRMLKLGAEDYLAKPLDIRALLDKLRAVCARGRPAAGGEPMFGVSSAMRAIEAMLPRVAASGGTVLITGESGVGKEEVARALHRVRDPRDARPFVAVNCGALTETLLEAELFGHVRGAFTGAARDRKGVFEQADGGTLFLDEIGDMSPAMQVKLLRAIEDRHVVRVGGDAPIAVSIRLVCATNRDLRKLVTEGGFREDLYYRVHVIHLHVPPLRERQEDIVWIAERLLARCSAEHGGAPRRLHRSAEESLLAHPWPGNIRELKNVLERACVLSAEPLLTPELLFGDLRVPVDVAPVELLADHLHAAERRHIESALRGTQWRIAEAAAALGISRKNLWEKMRKLGIAGEDG